MAKFARLKFRAAVPADAAVCLNLRGRTRQNALSADQLRALGITEVSWSEDIRFGTLPGYVCMDNDAVIGYCFGARDSGEIAVLALLPDYENQGVGRDLLSMVVADFRKLGFKRLFLGCSPDSETRSFGFYRHLGWKSTGTLDSAGNEVLEYYLDVESR